MQGSYFATLTVGFLLGGAVAVQAQTPDNPPAPLAQPSHFAPISSRNPR